jgi:hypothetical protein
VVVVVVVVVVTLHRYEASRWNSNLGQSKHFASLMLSKLLIESRRVF